MHAMNLMASRFLDELSLTEKSNTSSMNIFDEEQISPPEETTMLIWDPNPPMPSDDLFEVQEPPQKSWLCKHEVVVNLSQTTLLQPKFWEGYQLSITLKHLFIPE
jgi:hypothetical protein